MKNRTVLFCGGHQTPAIAVIEYMRKLYPTWNIIWVGRAYAFEGKSVASSEYSLITSMHIPFVPLTTGRINRGLNMRNVRSFFKIPIGIVQSFRIIRKYKPDCVVSFGGYIAFPVALAAYLHRIPVIIHEQTHTLGLSNAFIANLAAKVCVTYPETLNSIKKGKGVVTGLPIRSGIFYPPQNPSFSVKDSTIPLLYITGGSTGAQSLNDILFTFIPELVRDYVVIHQTGTLSYEKALQVKNTLGTYAKRYIISPFFQVSDVAWIYDQAALIIGRSGANTVAEVSTLQKKALFVPLPWAGNNEQEKNARWYKETGTAEIVLQKELTHETFFYALHTVLDGSEKKGPKRALQVDGAKNMVLEIDALMSSCDRN